MATRTRFRCPARPMLAAMLACGLLAAGAALTASGPLEIQARPQPGPAALMSYRTPVRGLPAQPATPARPHGATSADITPSLASASTAGSSLAVGGCAFWDISCEIDSWLSSLVVSALKPLLGIVAQTGLSTPDLSSVPAVTGMWAGSAGVADTMFVLLILAGGMIVMGYQTYQATCTAKEIAPRLVIAMVAANTSLLFIPKAVGLSNAMSAALAPGLSQGSATSTLARILADGDTGSGIFLILLSLVAVVLAAVVALTYIIRLMAVVLLTGAAPLALACYALPHTAWAARWWWRAFAAVLIIPCAQALVLTAAVKVFFSPGWISAGTSPYLLNILITICLLYVMMRIPFWISRPALQAFGPGLIRRGLRFAFGAAVLSRAGRALRGTSAGASGRRGSTHTNGNRQRAARQPRTASTPPRRSPRPGAASARPAPRPGGAPGSQASSAGSPPSGPAPAGGPPAHTTPPAGGGARHPARHAPPLPYGDSRAAAPPPLPGDLKRRRRVPALPGGPARRTVRLPLPAAGIRPAQPGRRTPPLPAAQAAASGRPRPADPARRTARPPLPAAGIGPAQPRRRTPPPLPAAQAAASGRSRPAGPAAIPPLPAAGIRPAPGAPPGPPPGRPRAAGPQAKASAAAASSTPPRQTRPRPGIHASRTRPAPRGEEKP